MENGAFWLVEGGGVCVIEDWGGPTDGILGVESAGLGGILGGNGDDYENGEDG